MKDKILPGLNQDVNTGKNFATLRQIYYSLILAQWFKAKLKESFYSQYINKEKTDGISTADPVVKEKIFNQYLETFKKGVYNYVKREKEPGKFLPVYRQYYSGGITPVLGLTPGQKIRQASQDEAKPFLSKQLLSLLAGVRLRRKGKDVTPEPKNPKKKSGVVAASVAGAIIAVAGLVVTDINCVKSPTDLDREPQGTVWNVDSASLSQLVDTLLHSDSLPLRLETAKELGERGDTTAIDSMAVVLGLGDTPSDLKQAVSQALLDIAGRTGSQKAYAIVLRLGQPDSARIKAADGMAAGNDPNTIKEFDWVINDDKTASEALKLHMVGLLGAMSGTAVSDLLAKIIKSNPSSAVRQKAAQILDAMNVDSLSSAALAAVIRTDTVEARLIRAATLLGQRQDTACVPDLAEKLASNTTAGLKTALVLALARIADPPALKVLIDYGLGGYNGDIVRDSAKAAIIANAGVLTKEYLLVKLSNGKYLGLTIAADLKYIISRIDLNVLPWDSLCNHLDSLSAVNPANITDPWGRDTVRVQVVVAIAAKIGTGHDSDIVARLSRVLVADIKTNYIDYQASNFKIIEVLKQVGKPACPGLLNAFTVRPLAINGSDSLLCANLAAAIDPLIDPNVLSQLRGYVPQFRNFSIPQQVWLCRWLAKAGGKAVLSDLLKAFTANSITSTYWVNSVNSEAGVIDPLIDSTVFPQVQSAIASFDSLGPYQQVWLCQWLVKSGGKAAESDLRRIANGSYSNDVKVAAAQMLVKLGLEGGNGIDSLLNALVANPSSAMKQALAVDLAQRIQELNATQSQTLFSYIASLDTMTGNQYVYVSIAFTDTLAEALSRNGVSAELALQAARYFSDQRIQELVYKNRAAFGVASLTDAQLLAGLQDPSRAFRMLCARAIYDKGNSANIALAQDSVVYPALFQANKMSGYAITNTEIVLLGGLAIQTSKQILQGNVSSKWAFLAGMSSNAFYVLGQFGEFSDVFSIMAKASPPSSGFGHECSKDFGLIRLFRRHSENIVRQYLNDPCQEVKIGAIFGLFNYSPDEAADSTIYIFKSNSYVWVHTEAVYQLEKVADDHAITALRFCVAHDNSPFGDARSEAQRALDRLGVSVVPPDSQSTGFNMSVTDSRLAKVEAASSVAPGSLGSLLNDHEPLTLQFGRIALDPTMPENIRAWAEFNYNNLRPYETGELIPGKPAEPVQVALADDQSGDKGQGLSYGGIAMKDYNLTRAGRSDDFRLGDFEAVDFDGLDFVVKEQRLLSLADILK